MKLTFTKKKVFIMDNKSVGGQSTYITNEMLEKLKKADEQKDLDVKSYQEKYNIAIQNLDFDQAQEIKQEIAAINKDNAEQKIAYLKNYFDVRLSEVIETYKRGKKRIIARNFRKETEMRNNFSSKFIDLQNSHVKYLTRTLEQNFVDEYSIKMERPSAKVIRLYEHSKQLALQENFEEAKKLKAEAERLKSQVAQDIQKEIVRTYKTKINETLNSQENEIDEMAKKNEAELKKLEVLKLQQLQDHMNSAKILVSKLYKKFLATINQLPLTDKEKQSITRYCTKKYTEVAVSYNLLERKEEISPKKPNINPTDQNQEKAKYVSKRDFLQREFDVEFKSQAYQRASRANSQAASQASSRYGSYDSQY